MKKKIQEQITYNNLNEQTLKHAHQVDGSFELNKINTLNIEEIQDWEKVLEYTYYFWKRVNKTVEEGVYDEKKLGKIIWSEDVFNKYLEYTKHYQIIQNRKVN